MSNHSEGPATTDTAGPAVIPVAESACVACIVVSNCES